MGALTNIYLPIEFPCALSRLVFTVPQVLVVHFVNFRRSTAHIIYISLDLSLRSSRLFRQNASPFASPIAWVTIGFPCYPSTRRYFASTVWGGKPQVSASGKLQ